MAIKTSGTISFTDIVNEFGGAAPYSLNQYYRGGARVPATRNTYIRDPASGGLYSPLPPMSMWIGMTGEVWWNGSRVASGAGGTSVIVGEWTYHRGDVDPTGSAGSWYIVYRTKGGTTAINTNVPTSGQISFSQFYGATKT